MSFDEILAKMKGIISESDERRKRKRNPNCVNSDPPPKHFKTVEEPGFVQEETLRPNPIGSMGSSFKSNHTVCEPIGVYSDGDDIIISVKFKKSDLAASRCQPSNNQKKNSNRPPRVNGYQYNTRTGSTNRDHFANRKGFGCLCDENDMPGVGIEFPSRPSRVNGYQYDTKTPSTNSHHFAHRNGIGCLCVENFLNYYNSAGEKPCLHSTGLTQLAAEDRLQRENWLEDFLSDYGRSVPVPGASAETQIRNLKAQKRNDQFCKHLDVRSGLLSDDTSTLTDLSAETPIRGLETHIFDDDLRRRLLFDETCTESKHKLAPTQPTQSNLESSPESFTDFVKEKCSSAIHQKHSQHEETNARVPLYKSDFSIGSLFDLYEARKY